MKSYVKLSLLLFFLLVAAPVPAQSWTAADAERVGSQWRTRWRREKPIDLTRLDETGIRRLEGRHLVLYTDLPPGERVDGLPELFDQMVPRLCDFFELDPRNYESFRLEGFLIDDFDKFGRIGATRQVPNLRNGYALRCRIWLRNQSSDYYLRHLLLHEGVHAFMGYAFGAWGPPWYREGTAELLATHRWEKDRLTPALFPKDRKELSRWGRIEYVQNDLQKGRRRTFRDIVNLGPEDYDENEAYAWSWAFAAFCENRPRYRAAFRKTAWKLTGEHSEPADRFLKLLVEDEPRSSEQAVLDRLEDDWADYLANLDYGYDFERTEREEDTPGRPVPAEGAKHVSVRADRGWQNSGFRLERGKSYRITAQGRFRLADNPVPWWSESDGVTIRYHRGLPIGTLLGTIRAEDRADRERDEPGIGFFRPKRIGSESSWSPPVSGTLYFRINDFASELADNAGHVTIEIRETTDSP